ncbi:MAG: glycosyltransferase family 2 protein, partial [Pseudomonadota bacterium]
MSFPLVSVVIPAFNAADFIESTVLSALAQTYQNLEILVIDDGSTDDTQEALDQFAGQVRYHKRPNGGPAAARNTGIEAAGGKYVAFLDADDRWKPEKITKQVASLEELGNAFALSHTDVVTVCDERELLQTEKNLQPFMPPSIAFERLFSSNFIATSSVVCRKEVF